MCGTWRGGAAASIAALPSGRKGEGARPAGGLASARGPVRQGKTHMLHCHRAQHVPAHQAGSCCAPCVRRAAFLPAASRSRAVLPATRALARSVCRHLRRPPSTTPYPNAPRGWRSRPAHVANRTRCVHIYGCLPSSKHSWYRSCILQEGSSRCMGGTFMWQTCGMHGRCSQCGGGAAACAARANPLNNAASVGGRSVLYTLSHVLRRCWRA